MRGQRHAPAAFYPGKDPVPIVQEAGWAPGPVSAGERPQAAELLRSGFESPRGGYLSFVSVVCRQVEVSATR